MLWKLQIFEKTISGMYLGEIVRRVLHRMAEDTRLFGVSVPEKLKTPFSLRYKLLLTNLFNTKFYKVVLVVKHIIWKLIFLKMSFSNLTYLELYSFRTPDICSMHGDSSKDLEVVGSILNDVAGVKHDTIPSL